MVSVCIFHVFWEGGLAGLVCGGTKVRAGGGCGGNGGDQFGGVRTELPTTPRVWSLESGISDWKLEIDTPSFYPFILLSFYSFIGRGAPTCRARSARGAAHIPVVRCRPGYIDGLADCVELGLTKAVGVSNYTGGGAGFWGFGILGFQGFGILGCWGFGVVRIMMRWGCCLGLPVPSQSGCTQGGVWGSGYIGRLEGVEGGVIDSGELFALGGGQRLG